MVKRVMAAPINLYFDVTPIGRILNRFSRDLGNVEASLSWEICYFMAMIYQAMAVFVVAGIVMPWAIIAFPLLAIVAIHLYQKSINALRETTRIEAMTKSPLLSLFSETYSGASTIRSFNRQ